MAFERGLWPLAALLLGCASDAAPEPEPTLDTPGAFVAVDAGEGSLRLYRTLDHFDLEDRRILFVSRYRAEPRSFEEARGLAKDHDLPVAIELDYLGVSDVKELPYQVVWFRTLTAEEKERVP